GMRRIWNLFGDDKKPGQGHGHEDGSEKDEEPVEKSNVATQTPPPGDDPAEGNKASTPVNEERSFIKRKKKKKSDNKSKESGEKKHKKMSASRERTRSREKKKEEEPKPIVIAEAREIAAREETEEFENEGGGILAKTRIKQRDLKWKEESSSDERRKKKETPKKVIEARDVNKEDDEEFENDGTAPMARSKIKTRALKWKGAETPQDSPQKSTETRSVEEGSRRASKKSRVKVSEARDVNKADDEEFENDGGASMARSKIKTRDLKWKEPTADATPVKCSASGSDSGGGGEDMSGKSKISRKKKKPVVVEARDVNKADDEEFENDGGA
ncbi:hypothetical protein PFISCL1PPCAC_20238, partial [Pristionchus fissidentatus]